MSRIVAQKSDYLELLRNTQENLNKVKAWENQFNIAQQQVEDKFSYDISGAFANYKKQQRNLTNNPYLGTGFKEEISNELFGQYEGAYGQIKQQENAAVGELYKDYTTKVLQNEQLLDEEASRLNEINNRIYKFANIVDEETLFKEVDENGGLGYYKTDNGIDYELTDRGVDFYNRVFNTNYNGSGFFSDYLYNEDKELYDYYVSNIGKIRKNLGGLDAEHNRYTEDDKFRASSYDLEEQYKKITGSNANKKFNTFKEKHDYYEHSPLMVADDISKNNFYNKLDSEKPNDDVLKAFDKKLTTNLQKLFRTDNINVKTYNHTGHSTGWADKYSTHIKINTNNLSSEQLQKLYKLGGYKKGNYVEFTTGNFQSRPRAQYGEFSIDEFIKNIKEL